MYESEYTSRDEPFAEVQEKTIFRAVYQHTTKERSCLWCGKKFLSKNSSHRRCDMCKQRTITDSAYVNNAVM